MAQAHSIGRKGPLLGNGRSALFEEHEWVVPGQEIEGVSRVDIKMRLRTTVVRVARAWFANSFSVRLCPRRLPYRTVKESVPFMVVRAPTTALEA